MTDSKHFCSNAAIAGMTLAALLLPHLAAATLGERAESIQSDAKNMQGSLTMTTHPLYKVHAITLPSGTIVTEYVAADGTVFAVVWKGPSIPDLKQTLGTYFDRYVGAASAKHSGHRNLKIAADDFVVAAGGHMRAYSGKAYLPKDVPAGVDVEDLR